MALIQITLEDRCEQPPASVLMSDAKAADALVDPHPGSSCLAGILSELSLDDCDTGRTLELR